MTVCWWLTPLYDLVLSTALSAPKLFAAAANPEGFRDDTTLPVLGPGRGRTETGRLCCHAVDDRPWCGPGHPAAAVHSEDRRGERLAGQALARIRAPHPIEAEIPGQPAEHRKQVSHDRSRPIVDALRIWLPKPFTACRLTRNVDMLSQF